MAYTGTLEVPFTILDVSESLIENMNKDIAFDANTLSQPFFLICIRFDSSLFTNKVGLTRRGQLRTRDMFGSIEPSLYKVSWKVIFFNIVLPPF